MNKLCNIYNTQAANYFNVVYLYYCQICHTVFIRTWYTSINLIYQLQVLLNTDIASRYKGYCSNSGVCCLGKLSMSIFKEIYWYSKFNFHIFWLARFFSWSVTFIIQCFPLNGSLESLFTDFYCVSNINMGTMDLLSLCWPCLLWSQILKDKYLS